jgi:hypothetical protein
VVDVEEEGALEIAEVCANPCPHTLSPKSNAWCITGRGNFQQSYGPPAQVLGTPKTTS